MSPLVWMYRKLGRLLDRGWGGLKTARMIDLSQVGRVWKHPKDFEAFDDLPISQFRVRLERLVAEYAIGMDIAFPDGYQPDDRAVQALSPDARFIHSLAYYEFNGLCLALRLLGGNKGVSFDANWGRDILSRKPT